MYSVYSSEQLAQVLGVPLFKSDLYMPAYRAGRIGRWRLVHGGFGLDRGYYSGQWGVVGMPVLLREHQGRELTWMSLSPHEIESQELGCRYAYGHTVVMGLGMGWVAINMALNPAVQRVTVIELDPEVIELFDHSQAISGLPEDIRNKLHIVQADAMQWQPDSPVDFLYADIWRCLEEPQTLDDVRHMQANVQAETIYFWGQELAIHALAGHAGLWPQQVQRCVAETIALPLLQPADFDYPQMISDVVRLRRERNPVQLPPAVASQIALRPIVDSDMAFLFQLYASTRAEEKALCEWNEKPWSEFLQMQFSLQQAQYSKNHPQANFYLITKSDVSIGRMYVEREIGAIHLIDISLLPEYRLHGIGSVMIKRLIEEAGAEHMPVTLRVQKNNLALDFYQRLGFQIAGDEGVFWFMRHMPQGMATA
ncbi:MAG: GNAT family N-acetyltransferase [Formivibrio sp.]|nr:GNAT family N-acetyltransferase [Formivibrio sp.]